MVSKRNEDGVVHLGSLADPALLQENWVVSGGKYVGGCVVGLPLPRDIIVVVPTGRSVGGRVRGGLVRGGFVVVSHLGSLKFCGSLHENLVVERCVVVHRGSSKFSGSEHENFFNVVGRAVVVQRGLLKLLGSSHENAVVVSIRRGRMVVGFGHRGSDGLAAQFGLHRRSFSEPGSSHENAGVGSGGKYVAGSFVGRPLIREPTVVGTGCSAREVGPRVRAGLVLSV